MRQAQDGFSLIFADLRDLGYEGVRDDGRQRTDERREVGVDGTVNPKHYPSTLLRMGTRNAKQAPSTNFRMTKTLNSLAREVGGM
jgi:hypothetical protein